MDVRDHLSQYSCLTNGQIECFHEVRFPVKENQNKARNTLNHLLKIL